MTQETITRAGRMTLFAASLRLCGLSQVEAAEYLGVSLRTLQRWYAGEREPRERAWDKLRALYADQRYAVGRAPGWAQQSWPSRGAYMAVLAMKKME